MLRSTKGLCGSSVWGPITKDGLELTSCAREVILNAAIPLCIILLSVTNLIVRRCRSYYVPLPGSDPGAYVPVSKYDIAQFVISFFHLGFIGFHFGLRMDEYYENYAGLYLVIGAIGQFFAWLYIVALIACHFMTRRNQTQYAYLRHLLFFYAYFVIVACVNLRSMLKHDSKGYELVFSIWDAIACGILLACSLKRPRNPELKYASNRVISHDTIASLWSLLSFAWMTPIIKLGNNRVLTEEDLWELPSRCQAAQCYDELERMNNMDLLSRLLAANATNLVFFLIIAIFRSIFAFTTPFFLYRLLKFILSADHSSQYSEEPYLYVFGILLSELSRIIFLNQLNYQLVWLGIRVEQMLSILVYKKQLRLKTSPRASNNRINNVLTADVDDIAGFFSNLPFIITIPLEILVATVFLYNLLGWSSLIGVGVMILCLWSNKRFGRRVARLQKRVKKARDERVGEIFELLHAVRMIKMFAWERSFHERLMLSRKIELTYLRSLFWRTTMHTLLVHLTPFLVTLFAFAAYTYISGRTLTADIAFTSITLFNTLKQPLQIFPNLVVELAGMVVAIGRVEKFLHEPDVQRESSGFNIDPARTSIWFNNVDIAWGPHIREFMLKGVNLEFPLGKLSLICGNKFSGKSLLMLSLLRETSISRGIIHFPASSIAYVPQQAWLENATFRDNILFGEPFEDEHYWNIVDSCCLTKDFENFDQADFTEYDEKNMVLSDGQKARVALARALYSSARILLVDDCLSSLDANTARQIIDNCLNGPLVNGRTVIMVTQYVRYFVNNAAYIAILEDGSVQAKGTPEELREAGLFTDEVLGKEVKPEPEHIDKNDQNLVNQAIEKSIADKKNWAVEEARFQGKVQPRSYYFYFKSSGGIILWFILIFLFIIIRLLTVGETYWLKVWSEAARNNDDDPLVDTMYYIRIYALIALASAAFTIIRMAWQFSFVSLKGSKTLFSKLLNAILRAPLSFFDTAPLGRVMNRFSKDLGMVDQGLVTVISSFLGNAIGAISVLVVVTAVTNEFFLVSIVIIILYLIIGSMYINVSRELKRLQSITRSPVLSWYTETIMGIATIRAFNAEQRYVKKFIERLNTSNRTTYLLHMSNRWMSIRMGSIGAVASYLAGVFILWHYDRIDAGLAGFCLSYALGFVQIVFMLVKDYTTMETSLSSVERIKEYIDMPQEPPAVIENAHPPAAWPTNGEIQVTNLTVKYSPQFEPVLRDISFTVNAEEKIGIVGRTGSGKTTLANSFLRLTEATEGRIVIDGIDISDLGLEDLRSRLTIISQDPILFEGTIRSNLDIRNEYDDHDLWEALRRVHLVHIEEGSANDQFIGPIADLEDPVNEGGSNFSRGQRQLLCLARALLRQSKVIIMDEATASIDPETDNKIQETIRNEFNYATVLCISHRFKTIIDSDRILVLNEGKIFEFDTPYRLINNMDSLFRHLCEQTGELETLIELARLNNQEEEEMLASEEGYDEQEYEEDEETPEMEMEDYETDDDIQEDQQTEHESGHEVEEQEEQEEVEQQAEPEINAKDHDKDDREVS